MLTISTLTSASNASDYYGSTYAYYCEKNGNEKELEKSICWQGEGARRLGLSGVVKREDFDNLLRGKLPSGQQLGRVEKGEIKHRPGFDLTFNAPKSFSLLVLSGGDDRLIDADVTAVTYTLQYIETLIAQTRVSRDGLVHYENVKNLTIAKFRQTTSRENDPHWHTHCVVMNMVESLDEIWRSLSSDLSRKEGAVEIAQAWRNTFGMIYRAYLAHELIALGYQIEKTRTDGCFEIAGVPKDLIEAASKRRAQIENLMTKKGWSGGAAAQKAALLTRASKTEISPQQLQSECQNLFKEHGINPEKIVSQAHNRACEQYVFQNQQRESEKTLPKALAYAIAHLSEREALFSRQQLILHALSYAPGKCLIAPLEKAIDTFIQRQHLIAITPKISSASTRYYTTPQILALEAKTVALIKAGESQVSAVADLTTLHAEIKSIDSALTDSQQRVVMQLLSSQDRIIGVQGVPGSGKTRLLRTVKHIATPIRAIP